MKYELSPDEAALYLAVTTYVREEMNRAERFADGDEKRKQNVGFALQILQRRLASSPAAIHESLRRRKERLEKRLAEERLLKRGAEAQIGALPALATTDYEDEDDFEDAPGDEFEEAEEQVLDQATAARSIAELEIEIDTLTRLEKQARDVRRSGTDKKWTQLNSILDDPLMIDKNGNRRKLIIFTEPRDTLNYLVDKIRTRLGRAVRGGNRGGLSLAVAACSVYGDLMTAGRLLQVAGAVGLRGSGWRPHRQGGLAAILA